jgi:hypothetical protein
VLGIVYILINLTIRDIFSLAPLKKPGAEKRGILLFLFLTSNETKKISIKKLKIRPEIKLTQVDFF